MDRKGIMDLPIKLMMVMVLLSVSLPIISDAVDSNQSDMADAEMKQESKRIISTMALAHYSGIGSSRTVTVDLPAGCEISVGGKGSDAYSIRAIHNGNVTSVIYLDNPVLKIPNSILLTGRTTLVVTSTVYNGVPGMEVGTI